MKKNILFKITLFFVGIYFISIKAFASNIVLDGYFNDWQDKPVIEDKVGDARKKSVDIEKAKWYLDQEKNQIYLNVHRSNISWFDINWNFYVDIYGDSKYRGEINYDSFWGYVKFSIKDKKNKTVYMREGYWGEIFFGKQVEFGFPVNVVVKAPESGYEVNMVIISGKDRLPDSGYLKVSSISTYPSINIIFFIILVSVIYWIRKRKERYNVLDSI